MVSVYMSCSCRWKLVFNVGFHNLCAKCIVFCCCCKYRKSGWNQTRINYVIWGVIFPPPEPSLWNLQELSLVMESVWGGDIICSSWWKSAFVMKMLPTFWGSFFVHCNAIAENFGVGIDCLSKYWCDDLMKVEALMKIIRTQSKFLISYCSPKNTCW